MALSKAHQKEFVYVLGEFEGADGEIGLIGLLCCKNFPMSLLLVNAGTVAGFL